MKINRVAKTYLLIVGVLLNLCFVGVLFVGYFTLDNPLGLAVNKATSSLKSRDENYLKVVGVFLSRFDFVDGVATSPDSNQRTYINTSLFINAANPQNEYFSQVYSDQGTPIGMKLGQFSPPPTHRLIMIRDTNSFLSAIADAMPGDVISMAPGVYKINGRSIPVKRPGTRFNPVYVRSDRLGDVKLELDMLEGFLINAPFWVFENLDIQGVCKNDSRCEHAFHVIGGGDSFVLRNSRVSGFNAPIKVNGSKVKGKPQFPDHGLIEYNSFANLRVRDTGNPVTLLNINSVNNWVVRGNLIADFVKGKSDRISYGAFMKGNGNGGVFEKNLVICERNLPSDDGIRIGLSYGGGGTGASFCREKDCGIEHSNGVIRNNIIINCSRDVGIYLNRAANTKIYNNLLHNNLGIDVRFDTSSATVINNVISGRIKSRDGGDIHAYNNYVDDNCLGYRRGNCSFDSLYADPDLGDFRLNTLNNAIWGKGVEVDGLDDDICGNLRKGQDIDVGPIQYSAGFSCLQP